MKSNLVSLLFLGLLLTACSEDVATLQEEGLQKDPAAMLAESFYLSTHPDRTRAGASSLVVDGIERQAYQATGDTIMPLTATRAESAEEDISFEIQQINFHVGNQKGFAIVSDDSRLRRVYFLTENGQIIDTAGIAPLKDFIDHIPCFALDEIRHPMLQSEETRAANDDILIRDIVKTNWGQGWPFNMYGEACNCNSCSKNYYSGHKPIGCVATATAQTIAKCGKFTGTFYGTKDIDFSLLPSHYSLYSANGTYTKQVAQFFHEVALCCQMRFGCDGSGTTVKAAYRYLKDLGYDCSYTEGGINTARLMQGLLNGYPHIIGGHNADSGHAWLITGVKIEDSQYSYYCNWGHDGNCNGWSHAAPFIEKSNDSTIVAIYDRKFTHIYIDSLN